MLRILAAAALGAALAGCALGIGGAATSPPPPVVAAYYAGFDPTLPVSAIDASRLTDVIYAFAAIDADGHCALGEPAVDVGAGGAGALSGGNFGELAALKARFPKLQTEISIGGWSGSDGFSKTAATAGGRAALVRSCIALFLRRRPGLFDGFDIDWEFPVANGARTTPAQPADRANATLLLAEFRRQLDALGAATHRHYLLTLAAPAIGTSGGGNPPPETSYDLASVAKLVDWFNVMTYDLTGPASSSVTGFESPLYPTPAHSTPAPPSHAVTIDGTVRYYEAAGVPAGQIVIGAPFYGHVFVGVHSGNAGLFEHYRILGAVPSYGQIVAAGAPAGQRHWSSAAHEPWIYDGASHTFLNYDDPASMAAKAAYVVAHHLRGVMLWEIAMDDAEHSLLDALSGPVLSAARSG
jgi:chitinase